MMWQLKYILELKARSMNAHIYEQSPPYISVGGLYCVKNFLSRQQCL